jgi:hypothetical protein
MARRSAEFYEGDLGMFALSLVLDLYNCGVSLFIQPDAFLRDVGHRRGQDVVNRFRWAIRPIYRAHTRRRGHYEHLGTCTLFKANSVPLIVTAAHVIDHHEHDGDLWIGAEKTLVPLQGSFSGTERPGGDRSLDKYDFSVSRVSDELLAELGNAAFIDAEFVSKGRRDEGATALYACLGYPNSKNKDTRAAGRQMGVALFMHTGLGYNDRNNLGAPGALYTNANFFVEAGKQVTDIHGTKRSSVGLRGMSGGPVFHIGDRRNYNTMRETPDFRPLLEGIMIERSEANVIVAVSVGAIIETLNAHRLLE